MAICKIGNKEFKLWHIIASTWIVLGMIVGACWGVSKAAFTVEDRYNQGDECVTNKTQIEEVKLDVAANRKALMQQTAMNECSKWTQMVAVLTQQIKANPQNADLQNSLRNALQWQKETCSEYERLKNEK